MPIINSGGGGAVGGAIVSAPAAAGQVPVASSASAATWKYPPGYEIGYTQITATINVVSTTEATGTVIISPGAFTFDGGAVICEFFGHLTSPSSTGASITVCLFESTTEITQLATVFTSAATVNVQDILPVLARYRFTPGAGSHTYTVTSFVSTTTGTPKVSAGSGGTAGLNPSFVRFTKV